MTIRTPDDEIDRPGYFYPPFKEGWWYQGATYAGHSDAAVDWNRRTKTGGWLDDTGDPVYAAADGYVAQVDKGDGLVMLRHWGGTYSTEYRHMTGPFPKVGDKVQRGDRIGSIGNVAGDGRSFGAHLHHVHYRGAKRIRQSFYDQPVEVSVLDSDTRPDGWKAPDPVMLQGPPPKATWESSFKEASKALSKALDAVAAQKAQTSLATDERDQARAEVAGYQSQVEQLEADLASAQSRIEILESATQPDLTEVRKAARQSFKDEVAALPA